MQLRNNIEWVETTLGGQTALLADVPSPAKIVRHVWAHDEGRTYVITIIFPTYSPEAVDEAETAWQVILETFEFLPRNTEQS